MYVFHCLLVMKLMIIHKLTNFFNDIRDIWSCNNNILKFFNYWFVVKRVKYKGQIICSEFKIGNHRGWMWCSCQHFSLERRLVIYLFWEREICDWDTSNFYTKKIAYTTKNYNFRIGLLMEVIITSSKTYTQ